MANEINTSINVDININDNGINDAAKKLDDLEKKAEGVTEATKKAADNLKKMGDAADSAAEKVKQVANNIGKTGKNVENDIFKTLSDDSIKELAKLIHNIEWNINKWTKKPFKKDVDKLSEVFKKYGIPDSEESRNKIKELDKKRTDKLYRENALYEINKMTPSTKKRWLDKIELREKNKTLLDFANKEFEDSNFTFDDVDKPRYKELANKIDLYKNNVDTFEKSLGNRFGTVWWFENQDFLKEQLSNKTQETKAPTTEPIAEAVNKATEEAINNVAENVKQAGEEILPTGEKRGTNAHNGRYIPTIEELNEKNKKIEEEYKRREAFGRDYIEKEKSWSYNDETRSKLDQIKNAIPESKFNRIIRESKDINHTRKNLNKYNESGEYRNFDYRDVIASPVEGFNKIVDEALSPKKYKGIFDGFRPDWKDFYQYATGEVPDYKLSSSTPEVPAEDITEPIKTALTDNAKETAKTIADDIRQNGGVLEQVAEEFNSSGEVDLSNEIEIKDTEKTVQGEYQAQSLFDDIEKKADEAKEAVEEVNEQIEKTVELAENSDVTWEQFDDRVKGLREQPAELNEPGEWQKRLDFKHAHDQRQVDLVYAFDPNNKFNNLKERLKNKYKDVNIDDYKNRVQNAQDRWKQEANERGSEYYSGIFSKGNIRNYNNSGIDKIRGSFSKLSSAFKDSSVSNVLESLKDAPFKASEGFLECSDALASMATYAPQIAVAFTTIITAAKIFYSYLKLSLKVWQGILNIAGKISGAIGDGAKAITNVLVGTLSKELGIIKGLFGAFIPDINKLLTQLMRVSIYRLMREIVKNITGSIRDGINNLYRYSDRFAGTFAKNMDKITTALLWMRNSLATVAEPIINLLTPAIEGLSVAVNEASNAMAEMLAIITGADYWTRALKYPKKYAEEIGDMNDNLQGFDEIHKLSNVPDYTAMFEQVDMLEKVNEQLKDMFEIGDITQLGASLGQKIMNFFDSVDWESVRSKANKIGKMIATYLNGIFSVEDGRISLGSKFGQFLAQAFNTGIEIFNGFIKDFDFGQFAKNIIGAISSFLMTIDWDLIKETASGFVIGLVDMFNIAIKDDDLWYNIGHTIGEMWNLAVDSAYDFIFGDDGAGFNFAGLGERFGYLIKEAFETFNENSSGEKLGSSIAGLITGITDTVAGLFSDPDTINNIVNAFITFVNNFIKEINNRLPLIKANLATIGEGIGNLLAGIFGTEDKDGIDWSGVGKALMGGFDAIIGGISKFFETLANAGNIGGAVGDLFSGLIEGYGNSNIKENIIKIVKSLGKIATDAIKSIPADDIGKGIADLIDSFNASGAFNELVKPLNTLVGKIFEIVWEAIKRQTITDSEGNFDFDKTVQTVSNIANPFGFIENKIVKFTTNKVGGFVKDLYNGMFRAEGGYVDTGELFIAREAGPELVGTIGSHTAVANNSQIISGIAQGVYDAIIRANSGNNSNQEIVIQMDNRELGRGVIKYHNDVVNQTGVSPLHI